MCIDQKIELTILDDDEVIIGLIKRMLRNCNCVVHSFTVQEDCLAYLSEAIPAYLFVDMRMPGINGLQFITQLKNQGFGEKTRIFLCSGITPNTKDSAELAAMKVEVIDKDDVCNKAWLQRTLGVSESRQ